nr:feline leukemia virus subgroup C receptor-related protein 2 [Parasteatoda tepidariorum]
MGVFGNQLGIALGFIIPPFVIENNCTDDVNISYELSIITYPIAVINGVILLLTIFVFQGKPDKFPSIAQATKEVNADYLSSLKQLVTDRSFMFLFMAYGFIVGTYLAMSTLMNEMVLIHFPGEEVDAGWLGAIMVFAGMGGSILFGVFLDKTHRFKEVSVVIFGLSAICMLCYTFMIRMEHIWIQFLFFSILGVLMTGYIPVGFDFGAEITYPIPEAMSGSLLNASTMVFSIILTNVASSLIQSYGDFVSNLFLTVCILVGLVFVVFMKCELKRTTASNEEKQT